MENMKTLYYIETYNYFNQILIFETREEAVKWCLRATKWNKKEIEKNIKESFMLYNECDFRNFYSIFPNYKEV